MDTDVKSRKKNLLGVTLLIVYILFCLSIALAGLIGTCAGAVYFVAGSIVFLILACFVGKRPKGIPRYLFYLILVLFLLYLVRMLHDGCS